MLHVTIDLAILMLAIAIGFIKGAHKKQGYLRLLPFFLLLILCVEFTGQITQYYYINNTMLYNFLSIVQFIFYLYFFRQAIYANRHKAISHLMWILPLLCLINIFFIQGTHVFHSYTFTLGSVTLILLGVTYFYRLFKSDDRLELLREPAFWISISIVFFYICSLSFVSLMNYIAHLPVPTRLMLKKILKLIDAFAYLFFIIAFLCRSKNTRNSLY